MCLKNKPKNKLLRKTGLIIPKNRPKNKLLRKTKQFFFFQVNAMGFHTFGSAADFK